MAIPPRVLATPAAQALIARLAALHGPLMFHQSGGCCDGSAPICMPRGTLRLGGQDVLLGHVAGDTPVWIGAAHFDYMRHTRMTIDAAPGRGAGMSLETPEGMRFLVHSELFSEEEAQSLAAAGEPLRGDSLPPA
ncbi:MAG TPA: DUF779 domain-containing protein [Novosphingobium sp.]|nr:DUF779 domain-containing protein [Novosphingobium sp.]HZV10687.1 DUF779 domain-containing protein [Novosphingobium sp.]